MLIISAVTVSQFFPFAMALSVTRRMYYVATVVLQVAQAVVFAVLLLLKLVENATGGWGMRLRFFGVPGVAQDNPLVQILAYAAPLVVLSLIGTFCGVVFKRWGTSGVFGLMIAATLVIGGLVALVTWLRGWPAVGDWLSGQSPSSLFVGWPVLLAVVLAGGGYLAVRKATP
jgi:hypothetical protein